MSEKYALLRLSNAARRLATQQSPAMYAQRVLRAGDTAIAEQRRRLYLRNVQQLCKYFTLVFSSAYHTSVQALKPETSRYAITVAMRPSWLMSSDN